MPANNSPATLKLTQSPEIATVCTVLNYEVEWLCLIFRVGCDLVVLLGLFQLTEEGTDYLWYIDDNGTVGNRPGSSEMPSCVGSSLESTVVKHVFYPTYDIHHGLPWLGPDPLSHDTRGEDLFNYMATFLLQEQINWIEFRLRLSSYLSVGFADESVFFLPRRESFMGNLPRIRELIHRLLSETPSCLETKRQIQLGIYPYRENFSTSLVEMGDDCPSDSDYSNPLDPEWFVLNIAANFE